MVANERQVKAETDVITASSIGRPFIAKRAASMHAAQKHQLLRDLKTLATFIDVHCKHRHREISKAPVALKTHSIARIRGRHLELCASCRKLLAHAFVKRTHCPLDPTPMCKNWFFAGVRMDGGSWPAPGDAK